MRQMNPASGADTGLPAPCLDEIHDLLSLALDASERPDGYSQGERETRRYLTAALRIANRGKRGL